MPRREAEDESIDRMKHRDIISALFWAALGLAIAWGGYRLEIGTLHEPGSGFMFFGIGLIMVGLSLSILIQALRRPGVAHELKEVFWTNIRVTKILAVLLALLLYAYLFTCLGFILSTFLLLVFLFKAVEPQTWVKAILAAIITTLSAYGIFNLWLGSQLPKGLLGLG